MDSTAVLKPSTQEIKEYLKELLEDLDGGGLIITDDELINEILEDCGDFLVLRDLFDTSK